ncbi:MAG: SMP-30/gluconolactonase/LRE family protein [Hymenobacteraceae bacterium]|nr:SMP-30/gluconolactonase/LRE family protein [Hymenobacteraceae bacterium]
MSNSRQQTELKAELALDAMARLGEGAIWHPQEKVLYWVDIEGKALHLYNPKNGEDRKIDVGARIGTVVPVEGGSALVALQNGIHKINTTTGELTFLKNPLKQPDIRFNDGKCDPKGRFWVGTMALDSREGAAVLYRMDHDLSLYLMLEKLTISNGIVWTADCQTMYFTDTPTRQVQAFDYDNESGGISNGRVVIEIPKGAGSPDGMTLDAEGKLWVALHGGAAVGRFDPQTGQMLQKVEVPATNVTSCAFGGENLDTLYITTGREWLSEEVLEKYPHSGGLFKVKPGVRGVPADFYRGSV